MKTVLLAAGRSKRLKPIADKHFLEFFGRPLITRQFDELVAAGLNDFVVVAGAHNIAVLRDLTKDLSQELNVEIQVVEQENLDEGMAGAILSLRETIPDGPVLVVNANDMVAQEAFAKVLKAMEDGIDGALLANEVSSYFPGGYLEVDGDGFIQSIVEKPGEGNEPSNLVNIVVHAFRDFSQFCGEIEAASSEQDDRYEVALDSMMKKGLKLKAVPYDGYWQVVKYPWHVMDVMEHYLRQIGEVFPEGRVGGKPAEVAETATIRGDVYLEEGVRIMDNVVIQGPVYIGKNTVVASNCLVRGSHIGANCVIGFSTEVARSYLGDKVWTHTNYVGDSIIGNNVSFGAGTVTGNLRFDEGPIGVNIKGEKVNTKRNKFGLITGDNVRTGVNTSFMPGVKIGKNVCVGAGIVIDRDIDEGKFVTGKMVLKEYENKMDIGNVDREKMKENLGK